MTIPKTSEPERCPMCRSIGELTSLGWINDERGTETCPSTWHSQPSSPAPEPAKCICLGASWNPSCKVHTGLVMTETANYPKEPTSVPQQEVIHANDCGTKYGKSCTCDFPMVDGMLNISEQHQSSKYAMTEEDRERITQQLEEQVRQRLKAVKLASGESLTLAGYSYKREAVDLVWANERLSKELADKKTDHETTMAFYEDEVRQEEIQRLRAETAETALREARVAGNELLDVMETCHICTGKIILPDYPVHCEDCSGDCENHEGSDCTSIYVLHNRLRRALSVPTEAPQGKFPIDRPCSACSAGDSEMKYHEHEAPFRPATAATKLISREEFISNWPEDSAQKNPYKVTFPEATKDVK